MGAVCFVDLDSLPVMIHLIVNLDEADAQKRVPTARVFM
jgi:hypothetical protein